MKKLMMLILSGLVAILLLQIIGCEGNAGKRGIPGDPGDPGNPYSEVVPQNRYFSMALTNNSMIVHYGAPKLFLAFDDAHTNTGDTVICQRLTGTRVPEIDGIDGGTAEWPEKYTDVVLRKMALQNNKIESVRMRAAWDETYIYFQLKWTEIADSALHLSVAEDIFPNQWEYLAHDSLWSKVVMGDEDRAMLLFEITPLNWFEHDGCLVTCHAGGEAADLAETNFHSTRNAKAKLDLWCWSSLTSNPTGYADDKFMDGTGQIADPLEPLKYRDGIKGDLGRATVMSNLFFVDRPRPGSTSGQRDTIAYRPLYQAATDPDSLATYPLWEWQITSHTTTGWRHGFAVPSFITTIPTQSRADIMARGKFDNGTWTVEFKRLRATGNGDDVKF
jgi:hypothetical protein